MFILFDILFLLYFILYLPVLLLRGKWHAGFAERFGFLSPETVRVLSSGENIWLHAVSVGEVAAIDGVIAGLRARFPSRRIVLTVTTKTGHAFAQRKYPSGLIVLWAPLDLSLTVDRFVRTIRPLVYIAAETELWPNLFGRLAIGGVPVLILNGRISDQAFPRYRWVKWLLKPVLERVDFFGMQSDLDAERIIYLGARKAHVQVLGNVKFDNAPPVVDRDPNAYGFNVAQAILLGGSTHPGEEEILIRIFIVERQFFPGLQLVLAPRHPERASGVADLVRRAGFNPVLFSERCNPLGPDDVLIIDTIGHLMPFYAISTVVFVGKSLTVRGGHNIIEPAMFGKPVIIGPFMQNFRDITMVFRSAGAVIEVDDAAGLGAAVHALLADPARREQLGRRAQSVIRSNGGATQRAIDRVAERVKE